jgi:hypothetical protein
MTKKIDPPSVHTRGWDGSISWRGLPGSSQEVRRFVMLLARLAARTSLPLATLFAALTGLTGASALTLTGCDLEVRAHADVPLGATHTLHVDYRSAAAPNGKREDLRP